MVAAAAAGGAGPAADSEAEEWDDASELSARRRRRFERALLHASMFTSAEGTRTEHHDTLQHHDPAVQEVKAKH